MQTLEQTGQVRRKISLRLILLALVISGLIFAVGVLIGVQLAGQAENTLQTDISNLDAQTSFMELASLSDLAGNRSALLCPVYSQQLGLFDNQTEQFRQELDFLSIKNGPTDPQVQSLESSYEYLEARDFLNLQQTSRQCGVKYNTALFFYGPSCPACDGELAALAQVKRESNFSVYIYSFDATAGQPAVQALAAYYNITGSGLPATVINGQLVYGQQDPQALKGYLYQQ